MARNNIIKMVAISVVLLFLISGFSVIMFGNSVTKHNISSNNLAQNSIIMLNFTHNISKSIISNNIVDSYKLEGYPICPYSNQSVIISTQNSIQEPIYLNFTINIFVKRIGEFITGYSRNYTGKLPFIVDPYSGKEVTEIPGLPAFKFKGLIATYYINSSVKFYLESSNNSIISPIYNYTVQYGNYSMNKTVVLMFSQASMRNISNLESPVYYYGISNPGMVSPQGSSNNENILIFTTENTTNINVKLLYKTLKTGNGSIQAVSSTFNTKTSQVISSINNILNDVAQYIKIPLKHVSSGILSYNATIPSNTSVLGNYVIYQALVTINNINYFSEKGFYYITNTSGQHIFLIDPHPFMWLVSKDADLIINNSQNYTKLLGQNLSSNLKDLENIIINGINKISNSSFEYLNLIGEKYDIYISYPSNNTYSELDNFTPKIIVLDNLFMGYNGINLLDWDLADFSANNTTLQQYIINYVEQHRDIGTIAISGTLSDLQYWSAPTQQTPIFAINDVGSSINNCSILNPNVLSSFLGFPLLPFYEFIKNLIAISLYNNPLTLSLAQTIGSAPLLIPEIPWNGSISVINTSVLGNLPRNFTVVYNNTFSNYGYNATTDVGWQLAMPYLILNKLFQMLKFSVKLYDSFYNVSWLLSHQKNISSYINKSLTNNISQFFNGIINSNISNGLIRLHVFNQNENITINKTILKILIGLWPVHVFAISKDLSAGIIGFDKYFVSNGYRTVFVSYDMLSQDSANIMLKTFSDLVNWSTSWKFRSLNLFHSMYVNSTLENQFNSTISSNINIYSNLTTVSLNGTTNISMNLNPGNYTIAFLTPFSKLNVTILGKTYNIPQGVGKITLNLAQALSEIKIRSDSELMFSPIYFEVVSAQTIKTYNITFTESYLPTGTQWYVNLSNGQSYSSTTNTISFTELNGTYLYTITTVNKSYVPNPSSGTFTVNGANVNIAITFTLKTYTVTFTETGLPSGKTWSVTLGDTTKSSNTNTITFTEPNGTYHFSIGVISGYTSNPSTGTIIVNGANVNQGITFTQNVTKEYTITFRESGLPAGTKWYVNLSNGQNFSSTSGTITFSEPNGTYSYTIATVNKNYAPAQSTGTFTVNGANVSMEITFNLVTYKITFTENGLPSGTTWYVNLSNGQSYSSSSNTITFNEPNGTYSYTIASSNKKFAPTQYSGSFTVNG
ncbi:MAG: hypothetical protein ACP5LA_06975, partial [Thermoplasmata archaeon]